MLWTICICLAFFAIYSLAERIWNRFQTSPMVISMDRNKFSWNTTFPAITICLHNKLNDVKVNEYISTHPEKFDNETDIDHFKEFLTKLSNLTFENMHELSMKKSYNISSDTYLDLLWNLLDNFTPEISSGTNKLSLQSTVTELGICHAVNSKIAVYNSYDYWKDSRFDIINSNETVSIHPLDGEVYAQIINITSPYELYFHGTKEVLDISKQRYSFGANDFTTVELLALEIFTSHNAKDLTISQRKCRFTHEADILVRSPVYSAVLCSYECRIKLALKLCNCIPHFYRHKGTVLNSSCIEKNRDEIAVLK